MKTLVCVEPHVLRVEDRPNPVRSDGEVLIRIRRVGICGTDYHIYKGTQPYLSYPRLIGHELAGEVAEAGTDSAFTVGQVVTVNPYLACGLCIACRRGKPNCCANIRVLGVHIDGGMSEFLVVPETAVIDADGLDMDQAAMVEFLAIGAHAVRRANVEQGCRVLVTGAGPIGAAVALFARLAGAGEVTFLDTSESRLAFVRDRLGFSSCAIAGADAPEQLAAISDNDMFDYVFDASGSIHAMRAGLAYVAHGGTYTLVGLNKEDLIFSDPEFHKRETSLLASRNALAVDFDHVIASIKNGAIPTDTLRTHRLPLDDAPTRIPELIREAGSVMKAIVSL